MSSQENLPPVTLPVSTKLGRALRLRCPVCWDAPMFRHPLHMHAQCTGCGYVYDRGNGYFIGAMYASYTLSLGGAIVVATALWFAGVELWTIVAICSLLLAIVGPAVVFPYSRLLWVWVEREGWLHDGNEDVESLKRAHLARHGGNMLPPSDASK